MVQISNGVIAITINFARHSPPRPPQHLRQHRQTFYVSSLAKSDQLSQSLRVFQLRDIDAV
jgi:hypothetical protein